MEEVVLGGALSSEWIQTPLGPMLAAGDDDRLYFLEFSDQKEFNKSFAKLKEEVGCDSVMGEALSTKSVKHELKAYFEGKLKKFQTPLFLGGTPFQNQVWQQLLKTPYGKTMNYLEQARAMGKEKAVRAVASANSKNRIAILIPCHRIISSSGGLGGYAGGPNKKQWLIAHEKKRNKRWL